MIEYLECLNILINIGSLLTSAKNKLFNSERKKEIAKWLYEIGDVIESIAISLSKNEYPHQTCTRMDYISKNVSTVIGDALTEKEEKHLQELLHSAVNVERTYGEYINLESEDKISYIQELYSISGFILGLADTIKYQK